MNTLLKRGIPALLLSCLAMPAAQADHDTHRDRHDAWDGRRHEQRHDDRVYYTPGPSRALEQARGWRGHDAGRGWAHGRDKVYRGRDHGHRTAALARHRHVVVRHVCDHFPRGYTGYQDGWSLHYERYHRHGTGYRYRNDDVFSLVVNLADLW